MSEDYVALKRVLDMAYEQASAGKGKERHANGKAFTEQPIFTITALVGLGFPLGQAMKKAQEARAMALRGEQSAAYRELLGAIVYLAAAAHDVGRTSGTLTGAMAATDILPRHNSGRTNAQRLGAVNSGEVEL